MVVSKVGNTTINIINRDDAGCDELSIEDIKKYKYSYNVGCFHEIEKNGDVYLIKLIKDYFMDDVSPDRVMIFEYKKW